MTLHTFQDGTRFLASSSSLLNEHGIELQVGHDFDEYREILAEARPGHTLGAPLNPDLQPMTPANSFWIAGRDGNGTIMHTQAMRCVDLHGGYLSDYLRHRFVDYPPSGMDLDMKRSRYRAGPGAQRIKGQVCYHGEFWMGGTPGQYRGTGLSYILGRYAFLLGLQMYDPDYIFGFMERTVVFKGFPARHGYMHMEPSALRWYIKNNENPLEGYLVYVGRDDIRFLLDMPLSDILDMAA
ncbi:hypothetical protein [uncultured Roseobacter sp.]|uniref:hypothetical protein n=1 Tax=uncultured Roseobacter sp. TaxID=114847 RepID=UPI00262E5A7A|nr:hypothetical protein [uncultured Roseobacter sp.]